MISLNRENITVGQTEHIMNQKYKDILWIVEMIKY